MGHSLQSSNHQPFPFFHEKNMIDGDSVHVGGVYQKAEHEDITRPNDFFGMKSWVLRSWWVIVFCTLCSAIFCQASHSRDQTRTELLGRIQIMQKEKMISMQENEQLNLQLQSESDPAWIETVLMKELGVVPEGWIKIHFKK